MIVSSKITQRGRPAFEQAICRSLHEWRIESLGENDEIESSAPLKLLNNEKFQEVRGQLSENDQIGDSHGCLIPHNASSGGWDSRQWIQTKIPFLWGM